MTLKTRLIPCLDANDGRLVKAVQFVDLIHAGDPVEAALPLAPSRPHQLPFFAIPSSP